MKKTLKKNYPQDKLFTVHNFKYDPSKVLLSIGPDVYQHAYDKLGYDLNKPKQLESFLRKCFRAYFGYKTPR
jgi:hypothetical protein